MNVTIWTLLVIIKFMISMKDSIQSSNSIKLKQTFNQSSSPIYRWTKNLAGTFFRLNWLTSNTRQELERLLLTKELPISIPNVLILWCAPTMRWCLRSSIGFKFRMTSSWSGSRMLLTTPAYQGFQNSNSIKDLSRALRQTVLRILLRALNINPITDSSS